MADRYLTARDVAGLLRVSLAHAYATMARVGVANPPSWPGFAAKNACRQGRARHLRVVRDLYRLRAAANDVLRAVA